MTSRECALKILFEVEKNGAYSDKALKKALPFAELSPQDRAFTTELVYGVIKNKSRIDFIIQKYSSQKLKKLSIWILNAIRIGVYQMIFLDKIPHSAAVNESVTLAKRYGHKASSGFVNGVLRSVSRTGDVEYPTGKEGLCIYYSHPEWLVDLICKQYGEETTKEILIANNINPPVTIRVNTLKTTAEKLFETLSEKGVLVTKTKVENIIEIAKFGDISALDEFKNGLFTVQDTGAYLCATAVSPQKNELIIDVCAAPGGKATQMAEMADDKATILAFDIHPHKIELIEKNAKRLGITSINAQINDATILNSEYVEKADKVLADVPCSGLGIIRKKPDIKWTKTNDDIKEIIKIQKKIIETSSKYLKPNGILVYSTCTINKDENEANVKDFIKNNPFEILEETTLLPNENNCDGFYICKMRKVV